MLTKDLGGESSAIVAQTHNSRLSMLKGLEAINHMKQDNLEQKKLDFSISMVHSRIESFISIQQNISSLKLTDFNGYINDFIGVLQSTILFFNDHAKNDQIAGKKVYREYILQSTEIIMFLMKSELELAGSIDNQLRTMDYELTSNRSSIATHTRLNIVPKPLVTAWLKDVVPAVEGLQEPQTVEASSTVLTQPEKPKIVEETTTEEETQDTITHLEPDTSNQESQLESQQPSMEKTSSFNELEKISTTLLEGIAKLANEENTARVKWSLTERTTRLSLTKQYDKEKLFLAQKRQPTVDREETVAKVETNAQENTATSSKNRP